MLSLFISWSLTPCRIMKITHGKRVTGPSYLSSTLTIIKTLEKLLKLCWLMVAEKLLVNSTTKKEQGKQTEEKKPDNSQSLGRRLRLSWYAKQHQLFRRKNLCVIWNFTCCVRTRWRFTPNFMPSKFRNLSHFNKEFTCHRHPLLSTEEEQ